MITGSANSIVIDSTIFTEFNLKYHIINNNKKFDIQNSLFVNCRFLSNQYSCISSTKSGIRLERVAFKNITNAYSSLNIASDDREIISNIDCSDSLSSYSKSSFYFYRIGTLIFKQLIFSSNECIGSDCRSSSLSYDEMNILQELKFLNIIGCSSDKYLLIMDSEPESKVKEKIATSINIFNSNGDIIIFVVSTYSLENFCLGNNTAKYTINYLQQYKNCYLKILNFWVTSEFRKTGDSFDSSAVKIGQSIIPMVVFLPQLNKICKTNRIQAKHICLLTSMLSHL